MAYIPPIRAEVDFTAAPWPADYIPPLRTEVDFVSYGGPLPPALIEGDGVCTIELLCTGTGEFYPIITGNGVVFIDFPTTGSGAVGRSASGEAWLSISAAGEGEVVPFFAADGAASISIAVAGTGATFVYRDASGLVDIRLTAAGSGAIGRSSAGTMFLPGLSAFGTGASRGAVGSGVILLEVLALGQGETHQIAVCDANIRVGLSVTGAGWAPEPDIVDEFVTRSGAGGGVVTTLWKDVANVLR